MDGCATKALPATDTLVEWSVMMLRQSFRLVLRHRGRGVDRASFVPHEVEIADREGNRLGADAEEAADVDDNLAVRAAPCRWETDPTFSSSGP